jgi:hypothetical protein
LVVGNSVFLPFHCEIITIWIGKEMSLLSPPELITDLADSELIGIREGASYTNLVFRKRGNLAKEPGRGKGHIIPYASEKDDGIFMNEKLHSIRPGFHDTSKGISSDVIDDPFRL